MNVYVVVMDLARLKGISCAMKTSLVRHCGTHI